MMKSFRILVICALISLMSVNGFYIGAPNEPLSRMRQLDLNFEPEDLHYYLNRPKRQVHQRQLTASAVPRDQTVIFVPNDSNNGYGNGPGYGNRPDQGTTVIVNNPDENNYRGRLGRYPYVNPSYPTSYNRRY